MKKIFLAILILSTLGLQSCNDWLDLRPENETVLEDYWQTESQATSVLAAGYRKLTTNECMERMMVWGELRSDNIVQGNSMNDDMKKILDVSITPTNPYADWGDFYTVINYCNTFLHFAPGVVNKDQNFTKTKLHTLEAEALALRALTYFYLVRTFKNVPLVTEPSINDSKDFNVPLSTDREVIDQIIKDLLEAQKYAKPSFGTEAFNKGRITLSAVNSILADVYLWDQQYEKCAETCDLVLADKTLELVAADKMLNSVFFKGNSTESILELQFDKNTQFNDMVKNLYGVTGPMSGNWSYSFFLGTKGDYNPFLKYLPESANDLRQFLFYGTIPNGAGFSIFKYALVDCVKSNQDNSFYITYRTTATTANWILYRLSDIILMKAEALVQMDRDETDRQKAIELVNVSYLRSNPGSDSLSITQYPDKNAMQELVLRERQRELMFEGKRWFDLLRVARRSGDASTILKYIGPKLTGDVMQTKKMSVMNALYMPIHFKQIEINPVGLTQNPFYDDANLSTFK